ncbi:hypothetical protein ACGFNU_24040 [Spirillospora sp. NPDC048911]|uniref:hypothetical protein n=1 Tax=Spirillospora sp. NPDC048911 TaxID=3364527 RepID=UPI003714F1AB
MTSPPADEPAADGPAGGGPAREELDQQVRDHYGTWRDQPKGVACAVIAAFFVLTTVAFGLAVLAAVLAVR